MNSAQTEGLVRELQAKNLRLVEENAALRVEIEKLSQVVEAGRLYTGGPLQQEQQQQQQQEWLPVPSAEDPELSAIQVVMLQPELVEAGTAAVLPTNRQTPVSLPDACVMAQ